MRPRDFFTGVGYLFRGLAVYEKAPDAVVATEEDLRQHGFGPKRHFEALLAFLDGEPAGFERQLCEFILRAIGLTETAVASHLRHAHLRQAEPRVIAEGA